MLTREQAKQLLNEYEPLFNFFGNDISDAMNSMRRSVYIRWQDLWEHVITALKAIANGTSFIQTGSLRYFSDECPIDGTTEDPHVLLESIFVVNDAYFQKFYDELSKNEAFRGRLVQKMQIGAPSREIRKKIYAHHEDFYLNEAQIIANDLKLFHDKIMGYHQKMRSDAAKAFTRGATAGALAGGQHSQILPQEISSYIGSFLGRESGAKLAQTREDANRLAKYEEEQAKARHKYKK